ncbi:MAG TPA: hypothetical protein VLI54_04545 [Bacillota bacterium]|nr:hypothetical protein [Bacillota bacterium]
MNKVTKPSMSKQPARAKSAGPTVTLPKPNTNYIIKKGLHL